MFTVNKLISALPIPSVLVSNADRNVSPSQEQPENGKSAPWKEGNPSKKSNNADEDTTGQNSGIKRLDTADHADRGVERLKERRGSAGANLRLSTTASKNRSLSYNEAAMDPLTAQILRRTNTDNALQLANKDTREEREEVPDTPAESSVAVESPVSWRSNGEGVIPAGAVKDKKKGVSFLSKLMGNKRRSEFDDESFDGDGRTEGNKAEEYSQPIGYIPTLPPPPKYIKVRASNKATREFNHIFLAQELYRQSSFESSKRQSIRGLPQQTAASSIPRHKTGAIWTMQFSQDGRYLATGGQDKVVRLWAVIATPSDRTTHEKEEELAGENRVKLNAPVFRAEPVQEYLGHTADVLDLSWSKNSFLLSSSIDKAVRLWHVSRSECLCVFQHKDFVTAIAFHPRDDRFFIAGSLDRIVRLWSIPDKSVAFQAEINDIITAVAFSPDGQLSIAGSLNGIVHLFETENMKPAGSISVRSSHGRNAKKGSKITGLQCIEVQDHEKQADVLTTRLLVTTNDSRLRIYNLDDRSLDVKLKGHENSCSQIRATFSDDARYIVCGSEDKRVYIWDRLAASDRDKRPMEYFDASSTIVTSALIAPAPSRQLLAQSGDPIYDLCDPPPVTLVPLDQLAAPDRQEVQHSRSLHPRGNIIVTSDNTGRIKVFRQDCAAVHRAERSETASMLSRHLTGVSRRSSIRSWRKSVSGGMGFDQSQSSLKEET